MNMQKYRNVNEDTGGLKARAKRPARETEKAGGEKQPVPFMIF